MLYLHLMNIDISSTSNPKIKWLRSLHSNATRRKEGVFLVEGAKEIAMALDGGYQPQYLFIAPEIYGNDTVILNSFQNLGNEKREILNQVQDDKPILTISKDCFEKVAYRKNSDGLLGVFQAKQKGLDELNFGENPFFLVVEAVEKPGNLGAIIRTADGAGADGVIICDQKADIFNPNVIRASVGTLFSKQVAACSNEELAEFLEKHEITPYGALLSPKSQPYDKTDFTRPLAIILGTEHEGLSKFWAERTEPIAIPMNGQNDSLNVSVAAGILAYEVLRQRAQSVNG